MGGIITGLLSRIQEDREPSPVGFPHDCNSPSCRDQTKAPPKPQAKPKPKAPAKSKAAPKKVLADVDENAEVSFAQDEGDDSGPSAPRPAPAAKNNKKSASETYTKVSLTAASCISTGSDCSPHSSPNWSTFSNGQTHTLAA